MVRDQSFYVSSLLELHSAPVEERKGLWRQALAALSRASLEEGPGPLDGIRPDALVKGIRAALAAGLVDDLDWLDPAAAGAALYTIASVLPVGVEQRELGRRVLARLLPANAEAFSVMAAAIAQSGGRALGSRAVKARIALVAELPLSAAIQDGPLALSLVGRREFAREWIVLPSTRSLPARRLASRLLERAAREAAKRATNGDAYAVKAFMADSMKPAWLRLLLDRESLVWRHVAVARGLIAPWVPELRAEIESAMALTLTPTEWRRAATSIAAFAAVRPEEALRLFHQWIGEGILKKDPGASSAFVWGLARAAEAEPEAATEMLNYLSENYPNEIAEVMPDLRSEFGAGVFINAACQKVLTHLKEKRSAVRGEDDGADALLSELMRDLDTAPRQDLSLREQLSRAVDLFATEGARPAYAKAREIVEAAQGELEGLVAVGREDDLAPDRAGALARRTSLIALRDLDISLLERDVLGDLLTLGASEQTKMHSEALDSLRDQLAGWIVDRAGAELSPPALKHMTLHLRRLRALVHFVDGDIGDTQSQDDATRSLRLRGRWLSTVKTLVARLAGGPPVAMRRTMLAAIARALDALIRVGACDFADAVLLLATTTDEKNDFQAMAEAAMDPDLRHVLDRYATFLAAGLPGAQPRKKKKQRIVLPGDSMFPPSEAPPEILSPEEAMLIAFEELAGELAPEGSARSEALRSVFARIYNALSQIATAPSLRSLSTAGNTDPDVVVALETWIATLIQMCANSRARLDPDSDIPPPAIGPTRALSVAVSRVLAGAETKLEEKATVGPVAELVHGLPGALGRVVAMQLKRLNELPKERSALSVAPITHEQAPLPAWLPARRVIGGYYVVRPLGVGGAGSVFVVNRVEDRNDPHAERFALKVPDYSATAARSLSEAEFLQLFRGEASALMALPAHPNLARFVTFDLAARPKPILVMELVEGVTLERLIETKVFELKKCFSALDDVLAGLETMHAADVGHLDLKPANVIMRKGGGAVLVDFGLAGRQIRPGCATGPYGAPEVWGVVPDGVTPKPMPADIYAFGCVAFESLTGKILYDAPNEVAQITQHIAHDGSPPLVQELALVPKAKPLAELLAATMRRDPRMRPSVKEVRTRLKEIGASIGSAPWPIPMAV